MSSIFGDDHVPREPVATLAERTAELEARNVRLVVEITDHERTEERLRNASLFARNLIEANLDPLAAIGRDGKILEVNEAAVRVTGVAREALIGSEYAEYVTEPDKARAGMEEVYAKGFVTDFALSIRHCSGKVTDVLFNASVFRDAREDVGGVLAVAHDITMQRRMERALAFDAGVLSTIQQASPDGILLVDGRGQIVSHNRRFVEMWAIPPDIAAGKSDASVLAFIAEQVADPPSFVARVAELYANADATSRDEVTLADGRVLDRITTPVRLDDGTYLGRVWFFRDISESKRAQSALRRLNRTLATLSAANAALVRATSETELLEEMCRVCVEIGGYRLAWVGFAEHDDSKSVRPVARAGEPVDYVELATITWADSQRGRGPAETAIRTGEVQVAQDIETDPAMGPWREALHGYRLEASAALPLLNGSDVLGILVLYSGERDAFGSDEISLLKEMAANLAFGIAARRDRAGREAASRAMQENLKSTVQAIATAVEMRDPYTAGHQRRVAMLAGAIAHEIGLTDRQTEGLVLAATVHDVGKINVPSELLNKPGRLTPLEYQVVQTHVQSGYDIIKGVSFPWPLAQIVLQHHERLDGSGYPNRLVGDAILLESRILAVADVVDSMMSHRPYRPALGFEAALDEIESGKGRLYDPAVVEACTALFRQKGFELPR